MKPMIEGNPAVTIKLFHFEEEKESLGTIKTTYKDLDAIGNHGAPNLTVPCGPDLPDFVIPSSIAFIIWADINGGDISGCVTSMRQPRWHTYEWQIGDGTEATEDEDEAA